MLKKDVITNFKELMTSDNNKWSSNRASGKTKYATKEYILDHKHFFDEHFFETKTLPEFFYCVKNDIFTQPSCECESPLNHNNNKYTNTCGDRKCVGNHITNNREEKIKKLHKCDNCNSVSVITKGRLCKPCGYIKRKNTIDNWDESTKIEYAEKMSVLSTEKYKDPALREKQSNTMKQLIKDGKYTPNSNNRLTHKTIEYNELKFRSSWELIFYKHQKNVLHNELGYEELRLEYYDTEMQKNRVYITDFIDHANKILYEVKPSSLIEDNNDKEISAVSWCDAHGYKYVYITETYIDAVRDIV